ncbi:MAG: PEP-CTERM sorting domain-containing protein [Bryobacterales bacterium]|nr:PEP-CTERM sorting domain-containing protein [Bryobacterales bacterium]
MKKLLTILVMLGVVTCPVFGGAITDLGLFNTGTSSNWQVGGVAATTATTIPGAWAPNTAGVSSWISTQADASLIPNPASSTLYNYTLQFTVPTTYTLSSIQILGRWALDDYGTASIGSTVFSDQSTLVTHYSSGAFAAQTFTINSTNGLVQGLNTLTFAVTNNRIISGVNPTGVRVEFTSITGDLAPVEVIPEPGTLVLLGGGLLALGFFRRRR